MSGDPRLHERSKHDLKKEDIMIDLYQKHVSAPFRKQLERMKSYISITVPDSFCVIIELVLLGFKGTEITEYVTAKEDGWEQIPEEWIRAMIECADTLTEKRGKNTSTFDGMIYLKRHLRDTFQTKRSV